MATHGRQQYFADEVSLQKESREFSIADEVQQKIDGIEDGAQVNVIEEVRVNGQALTPDQNKGIDITIPDVIDSLSSTSTTDALSANQGKVLYDYITNIGSRGRYLSNWNCATGLAVTNPEEDPYEYRAGDYYSVSTVAGSGGTNYRPDGTQYVIGQASTVVETEDVSVSDFYLYDGTNWLLLSNSGRQIAIDSSLSTTSTNPVENRVITNALNGKADATDTNTKTFYLSSTSDLTNAQAALDWYLAGKNPLIDLNGRTWTVVGYRGQGTPKTLDFQSPQIPIQTNAYNPNIGQATDILSYTLVLSSNASDVVTSVYIVNGTVVTSFLDTTTNYTYPYIPQYDGSPATKKYVDDKSTVISASIPSNPTEGMRWYNTTDDVLEVYDGTAWNPLLTYAGLEDSIEAGSNISIDEVCELDTRGPCPEGFHVPTPSEWEATRTIWTALGGSGGTNYSIALKMPFYGRRSYSSSIQSRDSYGYYWTCVAHSTTDGYRQCFITYSGGAWISTTNRASEGNSIRPFKNAPVTPDNTWTKLYGTSIAAGGIFWSATEGLISLSSDGTTRVTIADKNLGATTVWNSGDTLTETNSGKFYQWGNNYGFPGDGSIPSSGQSYSTVDASSYGPGNYYSGSKFIYVSNGRWDSSNNKNLWGGATQGNICKLQISATAPSTAQWGNITGTLSQQTDLQTALDGKVNVGLTKIFNDTTTVEIGRWQDEGGMQSSGHHVEIDPKGSVSTYNATVAGYNEATLGSANLTLLENTVLGGDETTVITQDGITITEGNTTKTYDFLGNDRIATLSDVSGSTGGIVDDTAYAASWDGVTTIAPSKNAVYDKLESMSAGIPVVASTAPSSATEGMIWYDSTNDVLKTYNGSAWEEAGTKMVVLSYGSSTWNDFINAYNKNAIVYCKASSNSNPATGVQGRMAFMAFVNISGSTPTSVEFQYYRSRSDHNTEANQLDEVYVYKLENTSGGTWSVVTRNTAAKAVAGTGISLTFGSGNMTIANTLPGATVNSAAPSSPSEGALWYDTTNDVLKSYDGANWNIVGDDAADINVKVFACPDPSIDQQGAIDAVQGAVDYIAQGKNALIKCSATIDNALYALESQSSSQIVFRLINKLFGAGAVSYEYKDKITGLLNNGTVTSVTETEERVSFLETDRNYNSTYTPAYNGSPATKKYVDDKVSASSTAPSSPTEGQLRYDTTNDVLKSYDGTNWSIVGSDAADINTKTFYLSSTSDLTNAQAAYDWYAAGKTPIIVYNDAAYILYSVLSGQIIFRSTIIGIFDDDNLGYSSYSIRKLSFGISSDTVISITADSNILPGDFLRIGKNYATPYTPQYDGSPATKKYVDDRDTYIGSSAPASNLVEGRLRYDTTNDQLKVYDGTNWNVTGKEYVAGEGIAIGTVHSDMQGPCPDGFHIINNDSLLNSVNSLLGNNYNIQNFTTYLKRPLAGVRRSNNGTVDGVGTTGLYWSVETSSSSAIAFIGLDWGWVSGVVYQVSAMDSPCLGATIRPIKNTPVVPDNSWTTIYDGSSIAIGAGIFHNATLGLISISSDGTTRYTIADKNLGATTVWNYGDTLNEANCGKYYQLGNNYGFPFTGSVTTSSTQVDASTYGPGNYYSSSMFITGSSWDSSNNKNIRGGVTQGTWIGEEGTMIVNTGVLSVNGQTGDVTVTGGDMNYSDFNWVAKTGATFTLDLASTITPSANFTVNVPATIKDGQTYILRVNNGATAYTMTLGTNVTNPYGEDLTLTANGIDQFVFLAIGGNLELQPSAGGAGGKSLAPNSPITTVKYEWYGTQAQYDALSQYYTDVPNDTIYYTI